MTNCLKCGKPLKLIGIERKNGKGNYKDWKDNDKNPREYHKKCYLEEQKYKDFYYNYKRWNITDTDKIDFLLN
jgi:hypothetical protein